MNSRVPLGRYRSKGMSLGRLVVNCKVENKTFGDPVVK
jgi:hypothetical protein